MSFLGNVKFIFLRLSELFAIVFGYFDFSHPVPDNGQLKSRDSLTSYGGHLTSTFAILKPILWTTRKICTTTLGLEVINGLHFVSGLRGVSYIYVFNVPCLVLSKVSTVKAILRSKENVQKSIHYVFMKPWLRDCLLTSEKVLWRKRRKLLAPTVYNKITESYYPIFVEQALILVEKLSHAQGRTIDVVPTIKYFTLDVIGETAMGVRLGMQNEKDSEYLQSIHRLSYTSMDRMSKFWFWPYWLFKLSSDGKKYTKALNYTKNFTMKIIEERKLELVKERREGKKIEETDDVLRNKKRHLSFLDLVLELHLNDKSFTLEDVQDEVEVFLLGGHDTSAMIMSWTLYLLGLNQDCLKKVHQELDLVLDSDHSVPPALDVIKDLKYLECVIKETARLYPPVPVIGRRLDQDVVIETLDVASVLVAITLGWYRSIGDNALVKKGSQCLMNIYQIHRDTDIYPEPEVFMPERFLPSNENVIDPLGFLAFSAGPRGCPGAKFAMLQMKVTLCSILRRFSVHSDVHRDKILLSCEMVLFPIDGIHVKIRPRKF